MKPLLLLAITVLGLGLVACSRSAAPVEKTEQAKQTDPTPPPTTTPEPAENTEPADHVISVSKDDPDMLAAFAKARAETDSFISVMQSGTPASCSVKVAVVDGDQTEYFWLTDLTYANGVFSGTLDNDPELVKNVKAGQHIDVKKEDIFDWLYMKDGKMYGNYTVRVLLPKMDKDEADKIRAVLVE